MGSLSEAVAVAKREYLCWLVEEGPALDFDGHRNRKQLHDWCLAQIGDRAMYFLEFGVHRGASFRWWVEGNRHPSSRFAGFDTFHGLGEPWHSDTGFHEAGFLTRHGAVPHVFDARATFYAGQFQETLPHFFAHYMRSHFPIVAHVDCDLYSSSVTVFTHLAQRLHPGDWIIMDEAGSGEEFLALQQSGIHAVPLAFAGCAAIARVV